MRTSSGNVTQAAQGLNMSRAGLYARINKSNRLKEALVNSREELVDMAEARLRKEIEAGNTAAILFTLKTLGKSRGYVERQEHTGSDGGALTVRVVYDAQSAPDEGDAE